MLSERQTQKIKLFHLVEIQQLGRKLSYSDGNGTMKPIRARNGLEGGTRKLSGVMETFL